LEAQSALLLLQSDFAVFLLQFADFLVVLAQFLLVEADFLLQSGVFGLRTLKPMFYLLLLRPQLRLVVLLNLLIPGLLSLQLPLEPRQHRLQAPISCTLPTLNPHIPIGEFHLTQSLTERPILLPQPIAMAPQVLHLLSEVLEIGALVSLPRSRSLLFQSDVLCLQFLEITPHLFEDLTDPLLQFCEPRQKVFRKAALTRDEVVDKGNERQHLVQKAWAGGAGGV
jgi:hypothetical protein